MGRRNSAYRKTLNEQAYERFSKMAAYGQSKKADLKTGSTDDKIYSYSTMRTYRKQTKYFTDWMGQAHPEVTSLRKAKRYANEWLDGRKAAGDTASTLATRAAALNKLFGRKPDDADYWTPPIRARQDIVRSRLDVAKDAHFSKSNNAELIWFCEGTGLRKSELAALRGGSVYSRDDLAAEAAALAAKPAMTDAEKRHFDALRDIEFNVTDNYIHVIGKGGRERYAPVIGKHADDIVARIRDRKPTEKVWQHIHSGADIHSYRATYATTIYRAKARPIDQIPYDKVRKGTGQKYRSDVYICRKDEAGKQLDRRAMLAASKALGHNRICIFADHYAKAL